MSLAMGYGFQGQGQVRSALTQEVNVIEGTNVNIHAVLLKVASGQLRFLGSSSHRGKKGCPCDRRLCST